MHNANTRKEKAEKLRSYLDKGPYLSLTSTVLGDMSRHDIEAYLTSQARAWIELLIDPLVNELVPELSIKGEDSSHFLHELLLE